ncbi:hypothetical protein LLE49_25815 [Alicyclobacillus tolerans]|uniref:hypothetical protein n=1 Tax=Alicyclobacillus tolerans TaxID=90970 RepID=UPI001F256386|nr:hypothetical protein [Alicyclobacillus tolerans]MCF8568146.1 hypothetical protein [Alicyclobacillus tolerans]
MDFVTFGILFLFSVTAAFLYFTANSTEYMRDQVRARVTSQWRSLRIQTNKRMTDPELGRLLEQTGLPITPAIYSWIRMIAVGIACLYSLRIVFLWHHYIFLVLPVIVWVFFEYRKSSIIHPMYPVLLMLRKRAAQGRNKELFLLFELVYQDFLSYQDHPRSVYSILEQNAPLLNRLQKPLARSLTIYPRDPSLALSRFASDVGTDEAVIFTNLLGEIEHASPEVALDIMQTTQLEFRKHRIDIFRHRLYLRNLVGLVLVMLGFIAVAQNFNLDIQAYTHALLQM